MIGSILKALGEAYEEREAAEDLLKSANARIESCMTQLTGLGFSLTDAPKEEPKSSISISEYAKARGVSDTRIYQLIRDRTLTSPAWLPGNLIIADEADEMILASVGPGKLRNSILDAVAAKKRGNGVDHS